MSTLAIGSLVIFHWEAYTNHGDVSLPMVITITPSHALYMYACDREWVHKEVAEMVILKTSIILVFLLRCSAYINRILLPSIFEFQFNNPQNEDLSGRTFCLLRNRKTVRNPLSRCCALERTFSWQHIRRSRHRFSDHYARVHLLSEGCVKTYTSFFRLLVNNTSLIRHGLSTAISVHSNIAAFMGISTQ